jgi:transcriptional regulator with XRE-family HTH domain
MTVLLRGDVLRMEAARRNQSLTELAQAVALDPRHLSRLVAGMLSPSPRTRRKLCELLGMEFESLFVIVPDRQS